ncbi:MAG: hypothetical protein SO123_03685, partial [Eubacteriales bacterium]|nr:hypothetical protein [Eubacteriales bacterium]
MEKIDNVNYDDYKYKSYIWKEDGRHKKPEKRKKTKPQKPEKRRVVKADKQAIFVVCTILLCFSLTFALATLSGKGSVMNFFQKNKNTDCERYYVVCSDVFSDESLARISADEARTSGGAGYIIYDEKYYLALACYKSRDDAEKVRKRMAGSSSCIYEICVRPPALSWCDNGKKDAVRNALKYSDTAFSRLYEITNSFEKGSICETEVKNRLTGLLNEINKLNADFDKIT